MPAIDPEKLLVIPIKEKHAPQVMKLIQSLSAVSLKGGGKVPIQQYTQLKTVYVEMNDVWCPV